MTEKPNDKTEPNAEELTDWERRKMNMYRQAAREATREVLESFGFSIDEMDEMQRDMAFIRRLRIASEAAGVKTVTSFVAIAFAAGGAIVTLGFQKLLGH